MVGIVELSRAPRYCTIRPGKKTFLLADFVSRQRAVDRSPDQQVVRCEASIGIISNEVGHRQHASRREHSWTTSVTPVSSTHRRCPAVCREAVFGEFPRAPQSFHRDKRPGNEVLGVPANYCSAWFYFYSVQSRDIHAGSRVTHSHTYVRKS